MLRPSILRSLVFGIVASGRGAHYTTGGPVQACRVGPAFRGRAVVAGAHDARPLERGTTTVLVKGSPPIPSQPAHSRRQSTVAIQRHPIGATCRPCRVAA